MKPKTPFLEYWYMALATPYGKEIFDCTPDFEAVRQKLYAVRANACDEDLKGLALCQSPFDPSVCWIVRKEPADATP